ncbi:MAG: transglycosylase domain-containing protein [Actinomycetota bacterium]|nr:transglycosylase domain-containing protein [Actinomycetota bacterium]
MRNDNEPSKLAAGGTLLLVAALLGIVSAFLIFPVFGGAGLAAKAAAATFDSLPTDLKTPPLPQRSTLQTYDGKYLASFYSENRITVTLREVPKVTQQAVIAIEDSRFYEHRGVDTRGILRALVRNQQAGGDVQGASTLTQQYVKRVLLEQAVEAGDKAAAQAAVDKNKGRKLREIRYALALEDKLSKDEILERYLNIAYFGAGAYGIGAAAYVYFHKSVNQLTLAESALLAGLLQSPSHYDPFFGKGEAAIDRRNTVLLRMAQLKVVPEADAEKAAREGLTLKRSTVPNGCAKSAYGIFCDYVRRFLLDDPAMGPTKEAREARLFKGGLIIKTTLDPRLQVLADAAARQTFKATDRYVGGLVVVQPGTGKVKAIGESRTFNLDQNPYMTHRQFQTGSTAKAFVAVAALQKGLPLTTVINAPHDYTSHILYNGSPGNPYSLSNDASGMHGDYDMRSGMAASVNTYFVQLAERAGIDNSVRAALAMGVSNPVVDQATGRKEFDSYIADPRGHGAFTLGAAGITPLDMANAYATLAAHGLHCTVSPIESVTDRSGKQIPNIGKPDCKRTIDAGVADAATEALSWVVHPKGHVTNGNTGGRANIGRQPVAGKTGTTQDIKEAWFVGYAPQLAVASVVFDPKHEHTLPNGDGSNRLSTTAFARFMKPALAGTNIIPFTPPSSKYLQEKYTDVPDVTNMSYSEAKARLAAAGFEVRVARPAVDAFPVPYGYVASQSPSGKAVAGSVITLYISNGQPPGTTPPRPKPNCRPPRPGCPPQR